MVHLLWLFGGDWSGVLALTFIPALVFTASEKPQTFENRLSKEKTGSGLFVRSIQIH